MSYEDVWPSMRIEDDERSQFQQRGELIVDYSLPVGDIIYMLDDLGIEAEEIRLEIVGAVGGLALRVYLPGKR